jgi:hypothetical protein
MLWPRPPFKVAICDLESCAAQMGVEQTLRFPTQRVGNPVSVRQAKLTEVTEIGGGGWALGFLLEISGEADGPALRRRVRKLADRREDGGDGEIVFGDFFAQARLELCEAAGQFAIGAQHLAQCTNARIT